MRMVGKKTAGTRNHRWKFGCRSRVGHRLESQNATAGYVVKWRARALCALDCYAQRVGRVKGENCQKLQTSATGFLFSFSSLSFLSCSFSFFLSVHVGAERKQYVIGHQVGAAEPGTDGRMSARTAGGDDNSFANRKHCVLSFFCQIKQRLNDHAIQRDEKINGEESAEPSPDSLESLSNVFAKECNELLVANG